MLPPRAWSSRDSLSNKGMLRSDVEDCVVVLCIVLKCFFLEAADEIHLQFCCLPSLSLSFISVSCSWILNVLFH